MGQRSDAVRAMLPDLGDADEREERLSAGLAMIDTGMTYRDASAACGIPRTSLLKAYHRMRSGEQGREAAVRASDERISDAAAVMVEEGFHRLGEAIYDGVLDNDLKTMAVIVGIGSDKLAAIRGWHKQASEGGHLLGAVMDRLSTFQPGEGVDVQLSVRRTGPDAIDVTPSGDESSE